MQKKIGNFVFPAPQFCFMGTPLEGVPPFNTEAILNQYIETGDLNISQFLASFQFLQGLASSELLLLPSLDQSETFSSKLNNSGIMPSLNAFSNRFSSLFNFSNFVLLKFCEGLNLSVTFYDASSNLTRNDLAQCEDMRSFFNVPHMDFAMCVNFDGTKFPSRVTPIF